MKLATVKGIYGDGLIIKIDGENADTQKHYKCDKNVTYAVGDRVLIFEIGNSLIVGEVIL